MTIREIARILDARWLCCEENADSPVRYAFASDMMSDVLAFVKDQAVLLTGLMNTQVVRTAEMMDMRCVVFVRDKKPTPEIVELAKESGIVVLASPKRLYEACGILYSNGLVGNTKKETD